MDDLDGQSANWVDKDLVAHLPSLISQGESQVLEFMRGFPDNARELAREIAAFASSNDGTILLGVDNAGSIYGLEGADTPDGRDALVNRLQGISSKTVDPAITPRVQFATRDGKTVMAILIKRGSQPIYYTSNVPYVRHLTEARPATPSEVIDAVQAWLEAGGDQEDPTVAHRQGIYGLVRHILVNQSVLSEEREYRSLNPWLQQWRWDSNAAAGQLRDYATDTVVISDGRGDKLAEFADLLDRFAILDQHFGNGAEMNALIEQIHSSAKLLMKDIFGASTLSEEDLAQAKDAILSASRKLSALSRRAESMVNTARTDDVQHEATAIGWTLLQIGQYDISPLGDGIQQRLHDVGFKLHVQDTVRLAIDGGLSVQRVLNAVNEANTELSVIADAINGH